MLQVMELEGVRYKKYVLQNQWTGIVIDRRFWTVRGATRHIGRTHMNLNKAINRLNKQKGKA
jgi:hypothetical protein